MNNEVKSFPLPKRVPSTLPSPDTSGLGTCTLSFLHKNASVAAELLMHKVECNWPFGNWFDSINSRRLNWPCQRDANRLSAFPNTCFSPPDPIVSKSRGRLFLLAKVFVGLDTKTGGLLCANTDRRRFCHQCKRGTQCDFQMGGCKSEKGRGAHILMMRLRVYGPCGSKWDTILSRDAAGPDTQ